MYNIYKIYITQYFHVLNSFHTLKQFQANLNLFILHNIQICFTYQEGFNMHTGQPNPQSIKTEYISGKIVIDSKQSTSCI